MGNDKKPGERNQYRLEYRPVRPYIPPTPGDDPPPIVRDVDRVPQHYHKPPAQTESNQPMEPHPMERAVNAPRAGRPRRRVKRPPAITAVFLMFSGLFFCNGALPLVGLWFYGSLAAGVGAAFGLGGVPSGGGMLVGLGSGLVVLLFVASLVFNFLCWVFDGWTDYKTAVIHEGTARALSELN